MNTTGENPRLGRRPKVFRPKHRSNINGASKRINQSRSSLISSGKSNRCSGTAKRGDVACGVARPSRNDFRRVVVQNEHRRFARDSRDIAVDELVNDQVAKDGDPYFGEPID
jgi:hypothetical protein